MKCTCGNEFNGNFCPICGKQAVVMDNIANNPASYNTNEATQNNVKKPSKLEKFLNFRSAYVRYVWCIICFISAFISFFSGFIFSGLLITAAGVSAVKYVRDKSPEPQVRYWFISIGLAVLAMLLENIGI